MEEKRPGQTPEADRQPDDPRQNKAARRSGEAAGAADGEDRARLRDADARGEKLAADMKAGGFGDHKGVAGFTTPDRADR